jgi:YfiH family protein
MADLEQYSLIVPEWPAPARVRAVTTTRCVGVSVSPYDRFNLGDQVGDDPGHVAVNRQRLLRLLELPAEPVWLNQVHGREVIAAEQVSALAQADAACAFAPGRVCAVLTADCLPVLLCDRAGTRVAAAHAGWRGLAAGVLAATVARLSCAPDDLLAWLGPAIGPHAFEVGDEVRVAFLALDPGNAACFQPSPAGRWLADIYELARRRLRALGVTAVYGGGWCTFTDRERFFSYRRSPRTGRMASLIWLSANR